MKPTGRGGPGRGQGRKPEYTSPMRPVNVMLDRGTIADARNLAAGNLSKGLRRAVAMQRYPVCQQPSLLVVYWRRRMAPSEDFEIIA